MKKSLYIVMPAYNEEENIEQVIKAWYPLIEEEDRADTSRLVVADSGSSDRTHEILIELQKNYPKLQILADTEKQHGPKVLALYKYAIAQNIFWSKGSRCECTISINEGGHCEQIHKSHAG